MPAGTAARASAASSAVRGDTYLWLLILASGAVRTLAADAVPLIHDEAYYWLWSRRLAWSYLDHPPFVAYLIFLGTRLGDGQIWVRLPALALGMATPYVLFLFSRDLFGRRAALVSVLLYFVVPLLSLGGLVMIPDSPLQLAWILMLRFVWQALHGRPQQWTWAGLALGGGLLSKLPAVFLGAGVLLFLFFQARPWLRRVESYRAALLALLLFLPVVYWNAGHNWAGARFVLFDRVRAPSGLEGLIWFLLPQVETVLLLFPAFVWTLWASWRRRADERFGYIFWTCLPAVLFGVLTAPVGAARGHLLSPVYLALVPVLAAMWNRVVAWLAAANAVLVASGLVVIFVSALAPLPGAPFLYGFEQAAAGAHRAALALGGNTVIITDAYELAAEVAYYTRDTIPVLLVPHNPASVWPPPERFRGATAIAVSYLHSSFDWTSCAERAEAQPPVRTVFRDRPLSTFGLVRLDNLSPDCGVRRP